MSIVRAGLLNRSVFACAAHLQARRWEAAGAPLQGDLPGRPAGSLRHVMSGFRFKRARIVQVLRPGGSLDREAFWALWPSLRVLGRCSPQDKLTIVQGAPLHRAAHAQPWSCLSSSAWRKEVRLLACSSAFAVPPVQSKVPPGVRLRGGGGKSCELPVMVISRQLTLTRGAWALQRCRAAATRWWP